MKSGLVLSLSFVLAVSFADTLDYSSWTVHMTAIEQSANADASATELVRRGLSVLRASYYDDTQTVEDFLLTNPKVSRRLDRLNLQPVRRGTRFLSDGTVSIEYDLTLTGPIMELLMPATGGGVPLGPLACPTCGQSWPEDKEVPPGITLVPLEEDSTVAYTGVLIDARGIDVNPALFPKIVTEDGRTVYSPEFFLPAYAAERGAVGYYDNIVSALTDDRLGALPLRINAIRSYGKNSTNLVIANLDARTLHGSANNLKLLNRCRVIIVTD